MSDRLFLLAIRMIENREEARDIVNNAFLKLLEQKQSSNAQQNINAYLFTIVKNSCIDYLRRSATARNNKEHFLFALEQVDEKDLLEDDTLALVLNKIYTEIEKLPPGCKEVFKLSYIDELKNREIAEKLQITEKTVRNQISKARKILRTIFQNVQLSRYLLLSGISFHHFFCSHSHIFMLLR
jgi:RNA polymerase sigma-70 factor (ECF subfamily)